MAGDPGQPAPDTDGGQTRAGSAGAPDMPELPEGQSTQAREDTGAAGADSSGSGTTGGQSGLDSPDPVTPGTKPSRETRGAGNETRTAGDGTAAPNRKAGTAAAASDAPRSATPDSDSPSQTTATETGDEPRESAAAAADGEDGGTRATGADDADAGTAAETQTAKRTPGDAALPGKLQLDFAPGSAKLSQSVRDQLATLAERLADTPNQRIQLMAFAKGGDEGASRARRLSLSRALAVRSFLIDNGIRSTRMDVRALGDTAKAGPLDRVDIVPANR
jgi:outer membrane protein OmpA-like peptidoglycan-associated protein